MRLNISSTGRTRNALTSTVEEMKKQDKSLPGRDTTVPTRDGKSYTLTKLNQYQRRDSTKNSDSMSTDHSTSSQDSQSRELFNATVPLMSDSTDTSRTERINSTTSSQLARLSDLNNGRTTLWKSNLMVDLKMSE
jgi:hypothetical protein